MFEGEEGVGGGGGGVGFCGEGFGEEVLVGGEEGVGGGEGGVDEGEVESVSNVDGLLIDLCAADDESFAGGFWQLVFRPSLVGLFCSGVIYHTLNRGILILGAINGTTTALGLTKLAPHRSGATGAGVGHYI